MLQRTLLKACFPYLAVHGTVSRVIFRQQWHPYRLQLSPQHRTYLILDESFGKKHIKIL